MLYRETKNSPRSFITISDLYSKYNRLDDPASIAYTALLKITKDFLAATAPDFSAERDWQQENDIKIIFDKVSAGLNTFYRSDSYKIPEGKYIYDFCLETINARLNDLRNEKDKICIYYDTHENPLKEQLAVVITPRYTKK